MLLCLSSAQLVVHHYAYNDEEKLFSLKAKSWSSHRPVSKWNLIGNLIKAGGVQGQCFTTEKKCILHLLND